MAGSDEGDVDDADPGASRTSPFEASTAVDGQQLGPGTNVGGYLIEGILGSGGMGVVYVATHPLIGKRAAIKVLKPELSHEPSAVERFINEARAVNQIGHRNIVDIFDFGALADGRHYYLMDLLEGESLRTRLRRTGALHISEAASVMDEIASALIAAHDKGIVHRDLKPDNVFMLSVAGRWPEVRLLDWGLAKLLSPTTKFRTATGSVLGTPVYMSPEQARASDLVDARTDIYSLGIVSYELLAGTVPFHRENSLDTLLAHQEDPVPSLAAKVPGTPEELVQLIEAMLAKAARDRPTLAAVRAVLKRLKGTKIPTMTAAGIAMTLPPTNVNPDSDPDDVHTIDHEQQRRTSPQFHSDEERTRPPRMPTPPTAVAIVPAGLSAEVRRTMPPAGPLDEQPSALPLPPPPITRPSQPPSAFPRSSMESMPDIAIEYGRNAEEVETTRAPQRPSVAQLAPAPSPPAPVPSTARGSNLIVIVIVAAVIIAIGIAMLVI